MADEAAIERLAKIVGTGAKKEQVTVAPRCVKIDCGSLRYAERSRKEGPSEKRLEIDGQVVRGVYRMVLVADVGEPTSAKIYLYVLPKEEPDE